MKHKFCFIRHYQSMQVGDIVYHVWVGSSLRDAVKLSLVEEFCKDCGFYFHPWSAQVDSALDFAKARFQKNGNVYASPFKAADLSISELYRLIIDDSFDTFESNLTLSQTEKFVNFRNTIAYFRQKNNQKSKPSCPSLLRKYLSRSKDSESFRAAMCFIGVLMVFIMDAILSYITGF